MKHLYIIPQNEVFSIEAKQIISGSETGSLNFGEAIDGNCEQGTAFEVESRDNNTTTTSTSIWDKGF